MSGVHLRNVALALLLCLAGSAHAADGVIELSQHCAVITGCGGSDLPGFPILLTTKGSYRLTTNLFVDDPAVAISAITMVADYSTLDLRGFEVRGAAACTGAPAVCRPTAATASGISVSGTGVMIGNGKVRGFNTGVSLVRSGVIERIDASENVSTGITVSFATSRVSDCIASRNGGNGFSGGNASGGLLERLTAEGNGGYGVSIVRPGWIVTGASLRRNGSGLQAASLIVGNVVTENGGDGVSSLDNALILDNTIAGNAGKGVSAVNHKLAVNRNTIRDNAEEGIQWFGALSGGAYRDNVITENGIAPVSGGTERGGNLCAGAGTIAPSCP